VKLIASAAIGAALNLASCGPLTPQGASAAETADALACAGLSLVPVIGPIVAGFCSGEEALLTDVLNTVLAHQDAGAPDAGAKALASSGPMAAVFQMRAGKRVHVGYVPASLAVAVQAELDKRAPK
jgi:hypothetical protein